jgi:hypothetical protein
MAAGCPRRARGLDGIVSDSGILAGQIALNAIESSDFLGLLGARENFEAGASALTRCN